LLPTGSGGFVVALIVTSYLMYDDIPARLYRNILVETDGKKYRLRILQGEVSGSQPYVHLERNRHSRLYGGEDKAREAAEMLLRKFEYVGWHLYIPVLPALLSIRQNRRHAEVQHRTRNCRDVQAQNRTARPHLG
jgi:hypothetical protein